MPPTHTPEGQPIRYVPRVDATRPSPATPRDRLPRLPPPAVTDTDAVELANAMRQLLIDAGLAREE